MLKVKQLDGFIGWSTGAQIGYNLAIKHPNLIKSLFLLSPSTGHTLHYALQPVLPWPRSWGKNVSWAITAVICYLTSILHTQVFDVLKVFNDSDAFHLCLEALAFFGGFPPIQPAYFHEYMKDTFHSRYQVRALFDLILSLNEAPVDGVVDARIAQKTFILAGWPDFLTGVYMADQLHSLLPGSKLVKFSMGSHFLLIEWPHLVGKELAVYLNQ